MITDEIINLWTEEGEFYGTYRALHGDPGRSISVGFYGALAYLKAPPGVEDWTLDNIWDLLRAQGWEIRAVPYRELVF